MTPDAERAALREAREAILGMAARQDEFADPLLYHHLTDDDRRVYRHAAKMLREAVLRHLKEPAT
jgi:hypothetical protein